MAEVKINGKVMDAVDLAELAEDADGWRPEAGDRVTGTVIQLTSGFSQYRGGDGTYPIVVLVNDSGVIAIHAFHAILETRLIAARPQVGERLSVKYVGESENARKGQNAARIYTVTMPDRDSSDFWGQPAAQAAYVPEDGGTWNEPAPF